MTLNLKALLIVGFTVFLLVLMLYVPSRFLFMASFVEIEDQDAREHVQRILGALDNELDLMDTLANDWATWDDTYQYMADEQPDYIQSNMADDTFIAARLNFIILYDASGRMRYGKGFNLQKEEENTVPQTLKQYLDENPRIVRFEDTGSHARGIIALPEEIVLFASRPIVTSNGEGPVRGALTMARYWNDEMRARVSSMTNMPLQAYDIDDEAMPPDFVEAAKALSKARPVLIQRDNDEYLAAFALVQDIQGNPCLLLKTEMARDIYGQAQVTMTYFLVAITVIGLLVCLLVYLLLKGLVVRPLESLAGDVREVGTTAKSDARVRVRGNDEIAFLARSINGMLDNLAHAQRELLQSQEHIKTLRGIVPICARCHNVKDSAGYWRRVDSYLREHTEAEFSHGICESCIKELYPEIDKPRPQNDN